MAPSNTPKVAFITGGNGITGSAITKYLSENTSKEEFGDIIVTSRSPFATTVQDPRIKFIALDFNDDPDTLANEMKDVCGPVTHAYFSSYVHEDDFAALNIANQRLFENFLSALLKVTPNLQNVCLQTGGKYYNVSTIQSHLLLVDERKKRPDQVLIAECTGPHPAHSISSSRGRPKTRQV